jgi:hypothetical protein
MWSFCAGHGEASQDKSDVANVCSHDGSSRLFEVSRAGNVGGFFFQVNDYILFGFVFFFASGMFVSG